MYSFSFFVKVLIVDGLGAHVRSSLGYLICLRHFIVPRAVKFFLPERRLFSFMDAQDVPSNILTRGFCLFLRLYNYAGVYIGH